MRLAKSIGLLGVAMAASLTVSAADTAAGARKVFDQQLSDVEHEVMDVVNTMPADKYGFVPRQGAFTHVRTFGVQARHIAFCLNEVAIALLGEKMLPHPDQEGPLNVTSKEDIVKYLKDAFAHAHRAIATLADDNLLQQIADPYTEGRKTTRLDAADTFLAHTWDHYGQMVEYLRMNNLTPPGHQ